MLRVHNSNSDRKHVCGPPDRSCPATRAALGTVEPPTAGLNQVTQFSQTIELTQKEVIGMDKKLIAHREKVDHLEKAIEGKQVSPSAPSS